MNNLVVTMVMRSNGQVQHACSLVLALAYRFAIWLSVKMSGSRGLGNPYLSSRQKIKLKL